MALLLLLTVSAAQQSVSAAESKIPPAGDLAGSGQLSQQQGLPVIVYVSRDACPYCRTLTDSILGPMFAADKFEHRATLVEVSLDRADPLTGFDGELTTGKAFGERYKANITPTLLFLDAQGHEISKRRVGISNLELYGHYLQKSIDEALAVTRSRVQQDIQSGFNEQ